MARTIIASMTEIERAAIKFLAKRYALPSNSFFAS